MAETKESGDGSDTIPTHFRIPYSKVKNCKLGEKIEVRVRGTVTGLTRFGESDTAVVDLVVSPKSARVSKAGNVFEKMADDDDEG